LNYIVSQHYTTVKKMVIKETIGELIITIMKQRQPIVSVNYIIDA